MAESWSTPIGGWFFWAIMAFFWLYSGLWLLAGLWCLGQMLILVYGGRRTLATVAKIESAGKPEFRFMDEWGKKHVVKGAVASFGRRYTIGQDVPLIYVAKKPETFVVDRFGDIWGTTLFLLWMGLAPLTLVLAPVGFRAMGSLYILVPFGVIGGGLIAMIVLSLKSNKTRRPITAKEVEEMREAIRDGRTFDAIGFYSECTGTGLDESRSFVEALERETKEPAARVAAQ
jgi:hypothetical protein